jgi:short-subunit dehydrogenase
MKHRLRSISGISAVVTGASSGIGRSLALRLARGGARVGLVARREAELEALSEEIRDLGGESLVVPCDLTNLRQVEAAAARIADRFGAVDLLVNNAGVGERKRFVDSTPEDFERILSVNVLGAVHLTRALLPAMQERGRGWLVFMASVAGRIPTPQESAYVASKFALVGFAESLSLEVEDDGVHVLVVCPGIVDTPFFGDAGPPAVDGPFTAPIEPEALCDEMLEALAKGRRNLTLPKPIAAAYVARALAPDWTRAQVKRSARDRR